MMRWMFVFTVVLGGIASQRGTAAQEPHVATITLTETAPGAYEVEVLDAAIVSPFVVWAAVSSIGSDQGVVAELGRTNGRVVHFELELDLPLDGMGETGCYHVVFSVAPDDQTKSQRMQLPELRTRACFDGHVVTFPEFDGVTSPRPAPPSNVRVVRVPASDYPSAGGDTWTIKWDDNSLDEISFQASITLLDRPRSEDSTPLGWMDLPEVPGKVQLARVSFRTRWAADAGLRLRAGGCVRRRSG